MAARTKTSTTTAKKTTEAKKPEGKAADAPKVEAKATQASETEAKATGVAEEALKSEAVDPIGAELIVRSNVAWAAGAGAIPVPLADFAAVTTINIKMIRELSDHYGVEFRSELAKASIVALITGAGVPWLTFGPVSSLLKMVPVAGQLLGAAAGGAVAGAVTYATGKVFVRHFAGGGTLVDFNADAVKAYFREQLELGKKEAEAAEATAAAPQGEESAQASA